uniref:Layilin a n=1 Tax=Gadus morhua TaxID=8049 RepID=A0A8C4YXH9_GADMO
MAYFSDPRRRLNFVEAEQACRRDGGELLGVESASEQQVIEQLISEIRPTDGDFWIGLRRNHGDQESSLDCSSLYYWVDGSKAKYRNWHTDEPSCGYEVCVVMYHQPSAPPSMGGLYMFQWNDDNCETRNNFICKYTSYLPTLNHPYSTQMPGEQRQILTLTLTTPHPSSIVLSLVFHRPELDLHHASCHSPAVTFTHAAGRMLLKTVHWAVSVVWYMSVLLALHQVVT